MRTRPAPTTQPRPAHTAQGVRVSDYAVDGAAVLARGAKPYDAKLMVLRDYGREELAKRIEQAARHIEGVRA